MIKNIKRLVVSSEELLRLKANNETLSAEECRNFVQTWKREHKDLLVSQLGSKNQCLGFVHGMFFAPSFSKKTVPQLQQLFMVDACHLNFGKYTLFCCYGVTDNANMSPVAFGIIFGNENGASWSEFWKFVVALHPSMNFGEVTIITDQDKGQMNAIAEWLPEAGHFHCSHHRRGNIIKNHGDGGGKIKYSALWRMYNKLLGCRTIEQIQAAKDACFPFMNIRDVIYLNKLADTAQYLAARCDMHDDVYMYHRQASAGAEAMNAANFSIRQRTVVDLDNAMILLLNLCKRYNKQQTEAWTHDGMLTSHGNLEFEESFNDINHAQFRITVTERENVWVCLVKRIEERGPDRLVTIPKEPVHGSHFGR